MTNKYIIRNCPCRMELHENDCFGHTGYNNCCACIDCILKQIVEKCKEVENIENVETLYDAAQSGMFLQANRILKLLDIEECE